MKRSLRDTRGAAAIEFALVAPLFLMFLFLFLDLGRAQFTRQALGELAAAAARCAAVRSAACADAAAVQTWTVARAGRSGLTITAPMVAVNQAAVCNTVANMAQVTISKPYARTALTLLPEGRLPATMVATACFPIVS